MFKLAVREAFNLDASTNLDVVFELKLSGSSADSKVTLQGFGTFDAASTVAAMCAAKKRRARAAGRRSLQLQPSSSPVVAAPAMPSRRTSTSLDPSVAESQASASSEASASSSEAEQQDLHPVVTKQKAMSAGHNLMAPFRWLRSSLACGSGMA